MTDSTAPHPDLPPSPVRHRTFWQRRLVDPVLALLTQGVTPDKIAFTLAMGTGLSMFPFLGFTSLLNLGVGLWLRLNQPILQTLNQLLGPVHLLMIILYVRVGESIWGAEQIPFSIRVLLETFRDQPLSVFLHRFGWAGVHAFTAWALTFPILVFVLNLILRPILRHAARTLFDSSPTPVP
ncbi:MAG: DUF2062 domain-containing protein [Opitutaceae bacterium]